MKKGFGTSLHHMEKRNDKIFFVLSDFKQWPQWSPWLIMEPDCRLDYATDGKSYSWVGKRIGAGKDLNQKSGLTYPKPMTRQISLGEWRGPLASNNRRANLI